MLYLVGNISKGMTQEDE